MEFSATPLRSHLKRIKQKAGKKREESFKISRHIPTKRVLEMLIRSTGTHEWDGSFVCKELSAYLGAEVKKASKRMATKESSMEVVEQQSDPQPSEPQPSTSQPSEPQLSTSQTREPQPSTPQQSEPQQSTSQVEDGEKQ
jgi:FtsZ-interacting cell division protein ZipA